VFNKAVALALACLGIISFVPIVDAGIYEVSWNETTTAFELIWGWNPESEDSYTKIGTYWDVYVNLVQFGPPPPDPIPQPVPLPCPQPCPGWQVQFGFQHKIAPHSGEDISPLIDLCDNCPDSKFYYYEFGNVIDISDTATGTHGTGTDHYETYELQLTRSQSAQNTQGTFMVTHAPEPISSILFITGGALLIGRKYLRKKNWASN
jgi:hypothetical protein